MYGRPPEGSQIRIEPGIDSDSYSWSNGQPGFLQYGMGAFLLVWLAGWSASGIIAIGVLFFGQEVSVVTKLLLVFWLLLWVVGEVFVIWILYWVLKPVRRARLTLAQNWLTYETGTICLDATYHYRQNYASYPVGTKPRFLDLLRNKVYRVEREKISNLRLGRVGERLRLTLDTGPDRIEIARALSEVEREWLFSILTDYAAR